MLKKNFVFIMLAVLLLLSGVSTAQDEVAPVFCGSLSEADCQLLTEAQQTSASLESATFVIDGGLTVSNIPQMPFDSLTFTLNGEGTYAVDPAVMSDLTEMQTQMEDLFSNPEQIGTLYENLLNGLQGDITLTLTLPTELQSFSSESNPIPETLTLGLRLVEGIGYVNLDALAEQLPQADVPAGWYGFEVAKFSGLFFEQAFAEMGDVMEDFDFSAYSQFTNPEFLGKYMTVERAADEAGLAVFVMTLDYAGLLTGPELRELLESQFETQGMEMDTDELDEMMTMMGQMYDGISMTVTTRIGLEDQYLHSGDIALTWDMSALMAAMSMSSDESTTEVAPLVEFNLGITYDNFNAAPAIEAPDAVEVLTAEDAMGMMGGISDM